MPCCFVFLLALLFPRLILILTWLFNPAFINNAYANFIIPAIGLIFLPMTTLAYAWAYTFEGGPWNGGGIIIIVLALLYDLGAAGGGATGQKPSPK
jgi:hypothetical protein